MLPLSRISQYFSETCRWQPLIGDVEVKHVIEGKIPLSAACTDTCGKLQVGGTISLHEDLTNKK